jgi:three-Cys-motif partner protein
MAIYACSTVGEFGVRTPDTLGDEIDGDLMSGDSHDTVWKIEPHTQAKHEILSRYLDAWFPILGSWNQKVLFIDGFAGPGVYEGGEPGSPMIAIEAARKRENMLKNSTVMFLFNEGDKARHDQLNTRLEELEKDLPGNFHLYIEHGEFVSLAKQFVINRGDGTLVPTFAFVDPFGWSGVPIELIANLTRDQRSELFILFSFYSANRWVTTPAQQDNMRELLGCDDYLQAAGMAPSDRKEFLASLYERQLRDVGKFLYISRFDMVEKRGRTSYFLYHCTRSLNGLEVMRSAMWAIDPQSGRQFSDQVAGLEQLFDGPLVFDLEERLRAQFVRQRVPIKTVQDFVFTGTPFAPSHLKRRTLKPMQDANLIEVHDQKRRGTFPDGVEIEFRI